MSTGLPMFIIEPNGAVTERYVESLPDLRELRRDYLDNQPGEHVTVLWDGKRAHMFVDEMGALKQLQINLKGTAIYHNATRARTKLAPYSSLHDAPESFVLRDAPLIYGRVVFWPHRAPGWE